MKIILMRLRITIAMLEIRNRETLQSKVNICKSDVKIGDYADSLLDHILSRKKTTRAPRVHLLFYCRLLHEICQTIPSYRLFIYLLVMSFSTYKLILHTIKVQLTFIF